MADTLKNAQADGRAPWTVVLWETTEYTVFEDGFPVTPGHCLFVPKENTAEAISRCVRAAIEQGNINVTTGTSTFNAVDTDTITARAGAITGTTIGLANPAGIRGTTITADVRFVGDVTGNIDGDIVGNVIADDSSVIVNYQTKRVTGNLTGNVYSENNTVIYSNRHSVWCSRRQCNQKHR